MSDTHFEGLSGTPCHICGAWVPSGTFHHCGPVERPWRGHGSVVHETLTEERVRQIVREELKRHDDAIGAALGLKREGA